MYNSRYFSQIEMSEWSFSRTVFSPKARKPECFFPERFFPDGYTVPEMQKKTLKKKKQNLK